MKRFLIALTILCASSTYATTVNKCVDAHGKVTFTQSACSAGVQGESVKIVQSSSGFDMSDAIKTERIETNSIPVKRKIMPEPKQGSCLPHSDQAIRTAIIQHRIMVGMKSSDAVKAWGNPYRINRSSHGNEQWVYNGQYLYIDKFGCIESWN